MENSFQKILSIAYLAVSALIYFLLFAALTKLSSTMDFEAKFKSVDYVLRALSIIVGFGVFGVLYSNAKINGFMNEVVSELFTKVTWPESKDTVTATAIVIVTVVFAGLILSLFDWVFTLGLQSLWSTARGSFF